MTAEVADALAQVLRQQPNIQCLNLNDTSLTDEVRCIHGETSLYDCMNSTCGTAAIMKAIGPHEVPSKSHA